MVVTIILSISVMTLILFVLVVTSPDLEYVVQDRTVLVKLASITQEPTMPETFSALPISGKSPLMVTFFIPVTAIGSRGFCPSIDFGDGQTGYTIDDCPTTFTHTYTALGTYVAILFRHVQISDCTAVSCPPLQKEVFAAVTISVD
jgi:hypothetical protein